MRAVIRCDGSIRVGAGHVVRCLALADHLAAGGWTCTFATSDGLAEVYSGLADGGHRVLTLPREALLSADALRACEPAGVDLLVLDHYAIGTEYQTACRSWARRIAVIDDLADRGHDCDLLIDQAPGRKADDYRGLVPRHCELLLGPRFALLRPEFRRHRAASLRARSAGTVRRLLISFGAADTKALTGRALEAVTALAADYVVDVVAGTSAVAERARRDLKRLGLKGRVHHGTGEMAALLRDADIAIGAGGVSSLERCVLGLPTVTIISADNQRPSTLAMAAVGALYLVGEHACATPAAIAAALNDLCDDLDGRQAISKVAAGVCDGSGVGRVVEAITEDVGAVLAQ
jgi:UDP-2,4-diacetamido-2,4,6-trideoxy-beta-L-altropyranose hydrolase